MRQAWWMIGDHPVLQSVRHDHLPLHGCRAYRDAGASPAERGDQACRATDIQAATCGQLCQAPAAWTVGAQNWRSVNC